MDLQTKVPKGKYVVAVSGGVDSIVLLDLLRKTDSELVIAHFDHGIRHNSNEDAEFVCQLAKAGGLIYEEERANLGPDASEDKARKVRYEFLERIVKKHQAIVVITAHHQDDVIETSIINLLRGTGRHGLTSLKSRQGLLRPLLQVPKSELITYANESSLAWREDSTNLDTKYLRNKIRLEVIPKMTDSQRQEWLGILQKAADINQKLDTDLQNSLRRGLHKGQPVLNRQWFVMLPHSLAKEILLVLLRQIGARDVDRKTIERLTVQIKTIPSGKTLEGAGITIALTKRSARFITHQ
jgi:tRNA(Ile)-lysidine synthetase-like protein